MSYTPTDWKDHIVEYPSRFRVVDNGDGTVNILDDHGNIIQQGTSVNAANLNKMEQGIKDAHDAIAAHSAETTQNAHLAKNIGIEDTAGNFASTDVEGALAELFQFANDGKTGIASVIGSPATSGDTFSQLQMHIQNAKNTLATHLTNKGQPSSGAEALQSLVSRVANINVGKRFAVGSAIPSEGTGLFGVLHFYVSGLGFRPSIILARTIMSDGVTLGGGWTVYGDDLNPYVYTLTPGSAGYISGQGYMSVMSGMNFVSSASRQIENTTQNAPTPFVSNGAFRLWIYGNVTDRVNWIAFE
jgi:hypothetical protein